MNAPKRVLKPVLVYLDDHIWSKLQALGREQDRPAAGILRQFLNRGLAQYEREIGRSRDAAA